MSTYYVSKTGDDSNGGTDPDTDAKLTIAGAVAVSSADDTIDIGAGTYTEDISLANARIYHGAGMFNTTIDGIISNSSSYSGKTIKFEHITISLNATNSGYLSGSGTGSLLWFYYTRILGNNYGSLGSYTYGIVRAEFSMFHQILAGTYLFGCAGPTDVYSLYMNKCSVYSTGNAGIYIYVASPDNVFTNNVFSGNSFVLNKVAGATITKNNNCYPSNPSWGLGTDSFVDTTPGFVDAAGGDLRLAEGSSLINTGKP